MEPVLIERSRRCTLAELSVHRGSWLLQNVEGLFPDFAVRSEQQQWHLSSLKGGSVHHQCSSRGHLAGPEIC